MFIPTPLFCKKFVALRTVLDPLWKRLKCSFWLFFLFEIFSTWSQDCNLSEKFLSQNDIAKAAMYWSDWWPGQIWWATTALLISRLAISVESGLLAQKVMCCHGLLFTFEYQCNNCKRSLVNTNSSLLTLTWALIMLSWIIQAVQLILLNELTSKHHVCLLAIWWNMDFRSCKILSADFLCELLNTTYATFFLTKHTGKKI